MISVLCFSAGVGAVTAVDVAIAVAAMLLASASVTAALRVFRFAVCAAGLTFTRFAAAAPMPVASVTIHSVSAFSVAVAAVSVIVAVAVPVLVLAAVNVVVPHPRVVGVTGVPSVNVGSVSAMVSLAFTGAFDTNRNDNEDAAHATGFAIVSTLVLSTGASTAVDVVIATADTSVTPARVTATLRVFRFAACTALLAVTPAPIFTVHCSYALSVALAAVSVIAAFAAPPLLSAAVNVVLPHPLLVTLPTLLSPNVGSVSVILSLAFSGTFNANVYDMLDTPDVTGVSITSVLCFSAGVGAVTAVDVAIAVAAMLVA